MIDKLLSLDGRADRREFWLVHIPALALQLGSVCYFIMRSLAESYGSEIMLSDLRFDRLLITFADHRAQLLPFIVIPMLPELSVAIRRMNDRGRPGWWVVFLLAPVLVTLLIGNPHVPSVNPTYLTAVTVILLAWYFIELGMLPGSLGAAARAEKSQAWLASMFENMVAVAPAGAAAGARSAAPEQPQLSAAEAAIDRAVAERRASDRRGPDRRVGKPDTRDVKEERRSGERRGSAADRRGPQGFGRRGN